MPAPSVFLTDFSDRVSPMLVKELRQGLRARTFIGIFLGLQVFLAVMMISASASGSTDRVGTVVSSIIFTFFAVAVLIVQPLRGIIALSSEVRGGTLDMMVLTKLSAWRIVYGKWLAIVSQSALLLSTIVPYLILRYFLGGMNLVSELVFLALMFLTSMSLTALTVALSGCSSVIVRFIIPIIGLPMLLWMLFVGMAMRSYGGSSSFFDIFGMATPEARWGIVAYVFSCVYLGASMLSLGASLIAPAAENHSWLRRLVALVLMIGVGLAFTGVGLEVTIILVAVVGLPALVLALTDSSRLVETVCAPFAKWGVVGRFIGHFFYPTWASGVMYSIVLGLLGLGIIRVASSVHGGLDAQEWVVTLALWGGVFFPAAVQSFMFRGEGQRFGNYLLFQVLSGLFVTVLTTLSLSMESRGFLWLFCWNPLVFLPLLDRPSSEEVLLVSVVFVNCGVLLVLFVRALGDFRRDGQVIRNATTLAATQG